MLKSYEYEDKVNRLIDAIRDIYSQLSGIDPSELSKAEKRIYKICNDTLDKEEV